MSLGIIVIRFAWIAHKLVSSNRPTRYASTAFCKALIAEPRNLISTMKFLCYLFHKPSKGCFPDKQVSLFLVMSNLPKSQGSWPVSVFSFGSALRTSKRVSTFLMHSLSTLPLPKLPRFFASYRHWGTPSSSFLCDSFHSDSRSRLRGSFSFSVQRLTGDSGRCNICIVFGVGQWP